MSSVSDFADALTNAREGDTIVLAAGEYEEPLSLDSALTDVTIEAEAGVEIEQIDITADAVLNNVTLTGFDAKTTSAIGGSWSDAFVQIAAGATVDVTIDGCSFVGDSAKYDVAINSVEPTAVIKVVDCSFDGLRAFYSLSAAAFDELTFDGCEFANMSKRPIQTNGSGAFDGDVTINDCSFTACADGLVKLNTSGLVAANRTFTFTNNEVTNCAAGLFTVNTTTNGASVVVSDNIKDGSDWTPGTADGLK